MASVRWSPFQELAAASREMQSLTNLLNGELGNAQAPGFAPAMDVITRGDDLVVKLELPGVDVENDVEIAAAEDRLRVSGKRTVEPEGEKGGYHVHEMRYGRFERIIPLPRGTDPEAVSAEYKNGILELRVAGGAKRLLEPQPRHIPIQTAVGR